MSCIDKMPIQCQKTFQKEKYYKWHIKVHDENTFNCELCDKSFTTQRVLNLHIESTSLMISDDKGLWVKNLQKIYDVINGW